MNGGLDPNPVVICKICGERVFVHQVDAMGGRYVVDRQRQICNACLAPHKVFEEIWNIFNEIGRWRRKILKWMFPELIVLANKLREYYWNKEKK